MVRILSYCHVEKARFKSVVSANREVVGMYGCLSDKSKTLGVESSINAPPKYGPCSQL